MSILQSRNHIHDGSAWPLGAHSNGHGVNFAIFSAHAEKVELCLFDARGKKETARYVLPVNTDQIW
ncbi:MAG: hypothetical protein U9N14_01460, partial [Pseudomonadota bacterium]|nr:hypothetical protein [Pseudomonadota bacterium]